MGSTTQEQVDLRLPPQSPCTSIRDETSPLNPTQDLQAWLFLTPFCLSVLYSNATWSVKSFLTTVTNIVTSPVFQNSLSLFHSHIFPRIFFFSCEYILPVDVFNVHHQFFPQLKHMKAENSLCFVHSLCFLCSLLSNSRNQNSVWHIVNNE